MRGVIVAVLIAVSPAGWAQDRPDDRNVYDSVQMSEELVTVHIKRHMASLLYPVDMSSFVRPEWDEKFREAVMALQKQLGDPATGSLTLGEFNRLAEAARDIEGLPVVLPRGKVVTRSGDGKWLLAAGTGAMEGIANPINKVRIFCQIADKSCDMRTAEVDLKTRTFAFGSPEIFAVTAWSGQRVTAIRKNPCGAATMTIEAAQQAVTISVVVSGDPKRCGKQRPGIWSLVDGFDVASKLHQEMVENARRLVYEPAKKLVPPAAKAAPASQ